MTLSPLPPFTGLSYLASARKPFGVEVGGCGVKLPNNSTPLSIIPFPLRSRTSQASSAAAVVQPRLSLVPSELRSKPTPFAALVSEKPSPLTSIIIGLSPPPPVSLTHLHVDESQT